MSESGDRVSEPGWKQTSPPRGRHFRRTEDETTREGAPPPAEKSRPSPASSDESPSRSETSSSTSSASDELGGRTTSPPAQLARLVAELLQGASALVTLATRRRFNLDLRMSEDEARHLAQRISGLVSRRWNVRADLNDATDVAGAGGSVVSYVERVLSQEGPPLRAPQHAARDAGPVARPPAPAAHFLADEQPRPVPVTPERPEVHDRDGNAVPGSGATREAFLEGFDDVL